MSESSTIQREREDARAGKSPSTQAGEFVREEFHHIREGKHGARSTKQTIAIGFVQSAPALASDTWGVAARRSPIGFTARDFTPDSCRRASQDFGRTFRRRTKSSSHERARSIGDRRTKNGTDKNAALKIMIKKLKSGEYRLYSRKTNPTTGKHRNLGTFDSMTAAQKHERQVQFFKRH
jgi:hypothetical protein